MLDIKDLNEEAQGKLSLFQLRRWRKNWILAQKPLKISLLTFSNQVVISVILFDAPVLRQDVLISKT